MRSRGMAYVVVAAVAIGVVIPLMPTTAFKLALVLGVACVVVATLMARRGRVLDPAWVVVSQLFLLAPLNDLFLEQGVQAPVLIGIAVAPLPFVLAVLATRPDVRRKTVLMAPLVLLGLIALASLVWSWDPDYGFRKLSVWIFDGFLPAVSIFVLASARGTVSWRIILAFAVVFAVAVLLLGSAWLPGSARVTVFDQNPIWTARALFVGTIVAVLGPFRLPVKVVAAGLTIVAALMTSSLGPTVGMALGILAGLVESLRLAGRSGRRTGIGWVALGVTLGIGLILVLSGLLDPLLAPLAGDPNVSSRAGYLAALGPLFAESPLVGIGSGGFNATGLDEYPHNLLAEIAVELGVVGLVVFLTWIVMALRGALGSPLMVGLVVATTLFTMFSGTFSFQSEFWLFTGLAIAGLSLATREPVPARRRSRAALRPSAPAAAARSLAARDAR